MGASVVSFVVLYVGGVAFCEIYDFELETIGVVDGVFY